MPELQILAGDSSVRLYQAMAVRAGLKACLHGLRLNTAYTPKNCLLTATKFTGKTYGRGKKALQQAYDDLTVVIDSAHNSDAEAVGA